MVASVRPAPKGNWPSICLTAGLVLLALGVMSAELLAPGLGPLDNSSAAELISEADGALATCHPGRAILDYERARLQSFRGEHCPSGAHSRRLLLGLDCLLTVNYKHPAASITSPHSSLG